ncbi:MAG: YdcF family protein [Chloroflexi bacterium]|nr:YdcF family protein [Chloroflexota bacterium]
MRHAIIVFMWNRLRGIACGLGILILGGILGIVGLGWRIDRYGQVDRRQQADVIIVMGARVLPDGQPGPDLRSRTQHGVNLYREGWAPYLMLTGGFTGDSASAAAVARRLALAWGVPDSHIRLAEGSLSTWEDAQVAASLMRRHGWRRAIVVSHPLHLYRTYRMFHREGVAVYPSPTPDVAVSSMPWRRRAFLDLREALALVWSYLPDPVRYSSWTAVLQGWIYDGFVR